MPKAFWRKIFRFVLIFLFFLWGTGFLLYYAAIPRPTNMMENEKTDAIVVLTGGIKRIPTGLSLAAEDIAPVIFISGVSPQKRAKDLQKLSAEFQNLNIHLGHAKNTRENAQETHEWLVQNKIQNILLITDHYHMPRSLYEFHQSAPGIHIIPHPVYPDFYLKKSFRNFLICLEYLLKEYHKLIFAIIYHSLS